MNEASAPFVANGAFQRVLIISTIVIFIVSLYVGYEATIAWQVSPLQWNEGIGVSVIIILVLYALFERAGF